MTGHDVPAAPARRQAASGAPILAVNDLRLPAGQGRTGLHGVSFEVRPGEILGLYGLMGAGPTEVMESVLGVHADAHGSVCLEGRELAGTGRPRTYRGGHRHGARGSPGVRARADDERAAEHDAGACQRALAPRLSFPGARSGRGGEWGRRLRLKTPALDAPIGALSGGNQQKVVIARNVMTRPRVLLMDEPTSGVDVARQRRDCRDDAAARRLTAWPSCSRRPDLAEIQAAATRAVVMARGRITADCPGRTMTDEALASAASATPGRRGSRSMPESRAARDRCCGCARSSPSRSSTLVFSLLSPEFLTTGNLVDSGQARRHQRHPGDRHDVRHPQRRHRPVRRFGRGLLRHGRRPAPQPRSRPAVPRHRRLSARLVRRRARRWWPGWRSAPRTAGSCRVSGWRPSSPRWARCTWPAAPRC